MRFAAINLGCAWRAPPSYPGIFCPQCPCRCLDLVEVGASGTTREGGSRLGVGVHASAWYSGPMLVVSIYLFSIDLFVSVFSRLRPSILEVLRRPTTAAKTRKAVAVLRSRIY